MRRLQANTIAIKGIGAGQRIIDDKAAQAHVDPMPVLLNIAPAVSSPSCPDQPIVIKLALPPAAAVLIEVETSSSSQFRQ
jgi:hypothetical protein